MHLLHSSNDEEADQLAFRRRSLTFPPSRERTEVQEFPLPTFPQAKRDTRVSVTYPPASEAKWEGRAEGEGRAYEARYHSPPAQLLVLRSLPSRERAQTQGFP